MNPFPDASAAAAILAQIRAAIPTVSLLPGESPWHEATQRLAQLDDEELLGAPAVDRNLAACVRSGLLLRADLLDASHTQSQAIDTPDGSYWHGIMHRREPDYQNSKYWVRKVGDHPLYASLPAAAVDAGIETEVLAEVAPRDRWDPYRFVDACEAAATGVRPDLVAGLEALQDVEIHQLLAYCHLGATTA